MADPRKCTSHIKDDMGRKLDCPGKIADGMCSERSRHVGKYKTGYCSTGQHEGAKPLSPSGKALKTCTYWQTCGCECHVTYDTMYQIAEMERLVVNNSGYIPDTGGFVMPTYEERIADRISSSDAPVTVPIMPEEAVPGTLPATIAHPYVSTPSGRAARGELESQVKWACDIWVVDYPTPPQQQARPCTPLYVSLEIGRYYGIKDPSVGAIDAVFKRWELIRFAKIARKPTRFSEYTDEGIKYTLEGMKELYKKKVRV